MKRTISILLVLVMLLGICPAALADWGDDGWDDSSSWGSTPSTGSSTTVEAKTKLSSASKAQLRNIELAADAISGTRVSYGSTFSFNDVVGERSADNGYRMAINGRGVSVRGGGVGQVATTLYLALKKLKGISYVELQTYGDRFTGSYVASGNNAVVTDYANGRDFIFRNKAGNMTIEMWTSRSYLYCQITVSKSSSSGGDTANGKVGSASIKLSGTNTLKNNVRLAAESINGVTLSSWDEFSFNQLVGPRTENHGYGAAINGRGVRVIGGGVAQVASVIYMAVKDLNNVVITESRTYGRDYNQSYVSNADNAIVTDYNNDIDFCFRYRGYGKLKIVVTVNKSGTLLTCNVYENK